MPLSSAGQNSMCANNMESADPAAVNCCCPNRRNPDNHLSDAQRNRATYMWRLPSYPVGGTPTNDALSVGPTQDSQYESKGRCTVLHRTDEGSTPHSGIAERKRLLRMVRAQWSPWRQLPSRGNVHRVFSCQTRRTQSVVEHILGHNSFSHDKRESSRGQLLLLL